MSDEHYSDGIAHIRLDNVRPICKSGLMEDAAKTALIRSWSNKIAGKHASVLNLQLIAQLMSQWPATSFLTKSKVKVQDFLIQAVTGAVL